MLVRSRCSLPAWFSASLCALIEPSIWKIYPPPVLWRHGKRGLFLFPFFCAPFNSFSLFSVIKEAREPSFDHMVYDGKITFVPGSIPGLIKLEMTNEKPVVTYVTLEDKTRWDKIRSELLSELQTESSEQELRPTQRTHSSELLWRQ